MLSSFSTQLTDRKLSIARRAWLLLFALFIGLFVLGAPAAFQHATALSDATRHELLARGIDPNFPATYFIVLDTVTMLAFASIALLIVLRQPDDWMVMLCSLTLVGTAFLYTIPGNDAPVPVWIPALAIALAEICQVSFVYLFPIGQFIPRWLVWLILPMFIWRPLIWAISYLPNYLATTRTAENYGTLRQDGIDTALMLTLFAIGIGVQVYRYRRVYNRTQKLQTKWVLWGMLIAITVAGTYIVAVNALGLLQSGGANELLLRMAGRTIRQIALFMVPLTLGFSILRYRLWDIEILLQRTFVYAPLTAILAGIFAALVPLGQTITLAFTGQRSILATMFATMVVVAVAEPLKQTLQNFVDKKIMHAPDPTRHLGKFAERVQKRLSAVRTTQILRRLTDEAMSAFQAQGGAMFLQNGNELVRTYARGETPAQLTIDVLVHGKRIGAIALGERADQRPYSKYDRALLEKTAAMVGVAIEQDTLFQT